MPLVIGLIFIVIAIGLASIVMMPAVGTVEAPPMPELPNMVYVETVDVLPDVSNSSASSSDEIPHYWSDREAKEVAGSGTAGPNCRPGDDIISCLYDTTDIQGVPGGRREVFDLSGERIGHYEWLEYDFTNLPPEAIQKLEARGITPANTRLYSSYIEIEPAYRNAGWGSSFLKSIEVDMAVQTPSNMNVVRVVAETSGAGGWTTSWRTSNAYRIIELEEYDIWLSLIRLIGG